MASKAREPTPAIRLPDAPVQRLTEPLARFLHVQSASGAVLVATTVTALALANSPWSEQFLGFWKTPLGVSVAGWEFRHSLQHWINDGLMAIFFFVIGLEVKREIVDGELRSLQTAALPIAAALGGMVIPAAIYLALQAGQPGQHGWGIPMATDIAFVVGCMAILGSRVPRSFRVLLLSLAIADDIGAILVIAIGYSDELNWSALAWAATAMTLVVLMRQSGVRSIGLYVIVGAGGWYAVHESGVHPTIAGVVLGLLTPAKPWIPDNLLARAVDEVSDFLKGDSEAEDDDAPHRKRAHVSALTNVTREAISPLERLETALHPWVGFVIMPTFALANAGVALQIGAMREPVAVAVIAGLVLGKPIGITLFSLVAVRLGLARLPESLSWAAIAGGGVLAGIGFTMSLFIANLALEGDLLEAAKVGILGGSTFCAAAGMAALYWILPAPAAPARADSDP